MTIIRNLQKFKISEDFLHSTVYVTTGNNTICRDKSWIFYHN